jgi:hypothetical protein
VRQAYAHDAVVVLEPDGDVRAPGGAITVALCGTWDHEPPCPLAAHNTAVERVGDDCYVRVLFVAEPADETEVRRRVDAALRRGNVTGPDDRVTHWRLVSSQHSPVRDDETEAARQLTRKPRS